MNSPSPQPLATDVPAQMQHAWFLAWNAWAATFWSMQQNQWERWATWIGGGAPLDI